MRDSSLLYFSFRWFLLSMGYSLIDANGFLASVKGMNDWILRYFGWLFSAGALLVRCIVYLGLFLSLGQGAHRRERAKPILTRWQWFHVILCTTIAIGILFWGTAEPLYHLHAPPVGPGVDADTAGAARFAMSTMFMHWTFTPYSIYTVAGLMFALGYYNYKQSFSLSAMLFPVLGPKTAKWGNFIDAVSLYSLVAGMAASLGAGTLTISGGLERYLGIPDTPMLLMATTFSIVLVFVLSAITGLTNGIESLSNINTYAFMGIALFALVLAKLEIVFLFTNGAEGLADYVRTFLPKAWGWMSKNPGPITWTVFYWANWLAWAPVTAASWGGLRWGTPFGTLSTTT